jgi:hypothetical protein
MATQPVAYWRFNEGTGTSLTDATGNGNTGTWTGTLANAQWGTGKIGGCGVFNGTDRIVTIPDSANLDLTSALTISIWINPVATQVAYTTPIGKDGAYWLEGSGVGTDRQYTWFLNNGTAEVVAGFITLTAAAWNHVVLTYDGTTATTYLNGAVGATNTVGGSVVTNTNTVVLGNRSGFTRFFSGSMDEVGVWNQVLSSTEISNLYNAGAGADPTTAVTFIGVNTPTPVGTTTTASTTGVTPTMPTGTATGDRVFVFQSGSNTAGATPTNWTALYKDVQVGPTATAPGAGTGRRYSSCYYRDYDGVWTMPAFSLTSATQNTNSVSAISARRRAGDTWNAPTASSPGNTSAASTAYSVSVPSFATTTGAYLFVHTSVNDNVTAASQTLTQTGATFTGLTERADTGSATGNDVAIEVSTVEVTTGATATLTRAGTLSGASEGGTVVVQQTTTTPASGTTYQGAVTLSATATLSASAVLEKIGAVSLTATSTLTSEAFLTAAAAVSLTATATLTSLGIRVVIGASTLTAVPTLTVAGATSQTSAVSLAVTASLTSAAVLVAFGAVILVSTASLTVAAQLPGGAVSLLATCFLTPTGALVAFGIISLSALPSLAVSSIRITSASVTLGVSSALLVSASQQVMVSSVSLISTSSLSINLGAVGATATLTVAKTLTVGASLTAFAAVSLSSTSTLSATGRLGAFGSVTVAAAPVLTVGVSVGITNGSALLSALGVLTAGGIRITNATVVPLVATGSLSVNGLTGSGGSTNLIAASTRRCISLHRWSHLPTGICPPHHESDSPG